MLVTELRFQVLREGNELGVQNTTLCDTKAARVAHGRGASKLIPCSALRKNVRKLIID